MQNLFEKLAELLKKDERLVSQDGDLLKNQVQELAHKSDPEIIKILLSDKAIKDHFFSQVAGVTIFDQAKFVSFVGSKQFLPDSYTAFKNKIGLVTGEEYLNTGKEVVLVWPYKDCILEGGMTKEDQKAEEIFYNETLAPDDITYLLDPKVFTNFKRIDAKGERKLETFRRGEDGTIKDNLIIKGNNLLALHSLKEEFAGKVKLIYIDPPYNTQGPDDSFKYNDNFNHSTWLTFMKNRLEIAKQLLSQDGAIYIQLDFNEVHYCKVLMDEIFGRDNFQREIIWRIGWISGYKSVDKNWVRNHDSILFYSKNKNNLEFIKKYIPYPEGYVRRDGAKPEGAGYPLEDTWNCSELDLLNSIAIVSFSKEKVGDFKGQKNEVLIKRIIDAHTKSGEIVLDFFGGSGTTAAVCKKMGRQFISIEQIDSQLDKQIARLKKVLTGDQTGISKAVNWQGGGDFVYMELLEWNEKWMREIQKAKTGKDLVKIWDEIKDSTFLSWRVEPEKIDVKSFDKLTVADQKKFLIDCLNKNHLYVNYSEMDDKDYKVSEGDKKLNKEFYGR